MCCDFICCKDLFFQTTHTAEEHGPGIGSSRTQLQRDETVRFSQTGPFSITCVLTLLRGALGLTITPSAGYRKARHRCSASPFLIAGSPCSLPGGTSCRASEGLGFPPWLVSAALVHTSTSGHSHATTFVSAKTSSLMIRSTTPLLQQLLWDRYFKSLT